jgi:hypothetical protein
MIKKCSKIVLMFMCLYLLTPFIYSTGTDASVSYSSVWTDIRYSEVFNTPHGMAVDGLGNLYVLTGFLW